MSRDRDGWCGAVSILCIICGIILIAWNSVSLARDWPEEYRGSLNDCEQTYICPGERARDGKVFYKGGPGLVASLTDGLPNVSQTYNRTVIDKSGATATPNFHFVQEFHLIKGSTVKWDIHGTGWAFATYYFYKQRSWLCSGYACAPYSFGTGLDFAGSYTVDDDAVYYLEVSVPFEKDQDNSFKMTTCSFEVLHQRYYVEDVELERKDTNGTFSFPNGINETACVFVEYPCTHTTGTQPSMNYNLGFHLRDEEKKACCITFIALGGVLTVVGIITMVILLFCSNEEL